MLISTTLLSLAIAGTPPAQLPLIPDGATAVIHIPRPGSALPNTSAFLAAAYGLSKSAWLAPASINKMFQPALDADLLSPESLSAAGMDTGRPLTLSLVQGQWVACFYLPAVTLPAEVPQNAVPSNDASGLSASGVTAEDGSWRRGTLSFADRRCTTGGAADAKKILDLAKNTLVKAGDTNGRTENLIASTGKLASPSHVIAAFQSRNGMAVTSLEPKTGKHPVLDAEGRVVGAESILAAEGASKTAKSAGIPGRPQETPLWMELSLSQQTLGAKGDVRNTVRRLIRHLAPNMDPAARDAALQQLMSSMTGQVRMAITGVDGKQPTGSMHQLQQAFFAEVKDAKALQQVIAAFAGGLSKPAQGEAAPITKDGGVGLLSYKPVWFGIQNGVFYFGNDAKLIQSALSLKDTRTQGGKNKGSTPSLILRMNGPAAAEALKPVSLFDMANGSIFGTLFMVKSEFSGLLRNAWLELHGTPKSNGDLSFDARLSLEEEAECPCQKGH